MYASDVYQSINQYETIIMIKVFVFTDKNDTMVSHYQLTIITKFSAVKYTVC